MEMIDIHTDRNGDTISLWEHEGEWSIWNHDTMETEMHTPGWNVKQEW